MAEFIDDQTRRIMKNLPELDDTTELSLKDLPYIRMAMIDVSSHWYNIGIHFGIPTGDLEKIRSMNRKDPDNCLTCVLAKWLSMNWKESLGPPTWKKVIIAVASRVGGDHPAQACKIAKEYKGYRSMISFKDSDKVDSRPLTLTSQKAVMDALLNGVATSWISVGLFLGIPYNRLLIFKTEENLEDSVRKMVVAWLDRKYDTREFGEPTWRKLVEAVASRSGGGHQRLASDLSKEHPWTAVQHTPEDEEPSHHIAQGASRGPPPPFDPEVLTESDLPMLMVLLRPVADRWDIFCLQLGVMHTELRLIAANPTRMAGAPLTFLQDSLYAWLHGANGQCTISVLCDALRSEVVEEGVLSVTVEEKLKARRGP